MASDDMAEGQDGSALGDRVDAADLNMLVAAYDGLVRAGDDSVRAAWRFGQVVDGLTDPKIGYYLKELAAAMSLHPGTLSRYRRLYSTYPRPELAIEAAHQLQSYNIGLLNVSADDLQPVAHGRPLRGRHWKGKCHDCGSNHVGRIEVDADGNPVVTDEQLDEIVNGPAIPATPGVPEAQFNPGT